MCINTKSSFVSGFQTHLHIDRGILAFCELRNTINSLLFPSTSYAQREREREREMAAQEETKARVVKVESEESWNLFLSQASNQGCPVRSFLLSRFSYFFFSKIVRF
jgi:hypothetical protein